LLVLLLIPAIFLPCGALGGVLAYRLGFRSLVEVLAVGGGLALVGYLLGTNLLAYVIPVQTAFWLAGFLLLLLAAGILVEQRLRSSEQTKESAAAPLSRATAIISGSTALYALFFGLVIFATKGFDSHGHWPYISTIANGNFPVRLPQNPDFYVQYHYGFDLTAAAVQHIGNMDTWFASATVTTVGVSLSAALAGALGYIAWRSVRLALLLPVLLFFSGGLIYLDALEGLTLSSGLFSFGGEWANRLLAPDPFAAEYLRGSMQMPFGVLLHHPPTSLGMPIFLLFLVLAYVQIRRPRPAIAVLMGLVLGALALALETTFVIAVEAYVIYRGASHVHRWRREGWEAVRSAATYDGITMGIAGALAVLQGGVITDALLHRDSEEVNGAITGLSLRRELGFVSWDGFVPIGFNDWPLTVAREFGLPLLFFPLYVVMALKYRHPVTILLLLVSTLAFMTPLVFEYPVRDVDLYRLFSLAQVANGLLLAITLYYLLSEAKNQRRALSGIAVILGLTVISPLMFSVSAFPAGPSVFEPMISPGEFVVAENAKTLVPERSRVLADWPDAITVLWGRYAPYGVSREEIYTRRDEWNAALEDPNPSVLEELEIDYVYVSPMWRNALAVYEVNPDELPHLKRVYEHIDAVGRRYAIYEVQEPISAQADSGYETARLPE
jgi:hypothetical protein